MTFKQMYVLCIVVCCSFSRLTKGFTYERKMVNIAWMRETWLNQFHKERNFTQTFEKQKTVNFIIDHFTSLSFNVITDNFTIDDGEKYQFAGINVIGIKPGYHYGTDRDKIQIVGTYYDTEPKLKETDSFSDIKALLYNGGGIVAVLELSRLLNSTGEKMNTIIFVFFDFHFAYKVNGQCCIGSKHFVSKWLPNYLSEFSAEVKVKEAILLDSIMVYNGTQDFISTVFRVFKEVAEQIGNDEKANFVLMISNNRRDRQIIANFTKIFKNLLPSENRLITLNLPAIAIDKITMAAAERIHETDGIPFYAHNIDFFVLTDTECRKDVYEYDDHLDFFFKVHHEFDDYKTWWDAKIACEMEGARLAQLDTREEWDYFRAKIRGKKSLSHLLMLWIGMSDFENEGNWIWTDGKNVSDDLIPCNLSPYKQQRDCAGLKVTDNGLNSNVFFQSDCLGSGHFICSCERKERKSECEENLEGYQLIKEISLLFKVFEDKALTWPEANASCDQNLVIFQTYEKYAFIPRIIEDIPNGKYFIGLIYDKNKYKTINGHFETFPFPLNINETEHDTTVCGVLIYDNLSPRIGFENCDKKLPYICEINCAEKVNDEARKLSFDFPRLVIAMKNKLQVIETNNDGTLKILSEIITNETVYSFDILHDEKNIFWHRKTSTHIVHSKANGNKYRSHNVLRTDDEMTDIAVDYVTEKLYWACRNIGAIFVSEIDGTKKKILLSDKLSKPSSIQLEPIQGKLFWINDNTCSYAGMDGNRAFNIRTHIPIDVDWIRMASFREEESINLLLVKGNEVTLTIDTKNDFEVDYNCYTVFENTIDMCQVNKQFLLVLTETSLIMYHVNYFKIEFDYLHTFVPVSVYHLQSGEKASAFKNVKRRRVSNPCSVNNGNCENLCLLSVHQHYSCVCKLDDFFLEERNGSCNRTVCHVNNAGCSQICIGTDTYPYYVCGCKQGYSLLMDLKTCIRSTGDDVVFIHPDQNKIIYLEIDSLDRKIFFISVESNSVDNFKLITKDHTVGVIFKKQTILLNLIIDNFNGFIYVLVRYALEETHLLQMRMDGSKMKTIHVRFTLKTHISFALNVPKQIIYMISGNEIRQITTSGRNEKSTIPFEYPFIFDAIAVMDNELFLTDRYGKIFNLPLDQDTIKIFNIGSLEFETEVEAGRLKTLKSIWYIEDLKGASSMLSYLSSR